MGEGVEEQKFTGVLRRRRRGFRHIVSDVIRQQKTQKRTEISAEYLRNDGWNHVFRIFSKFLCK